MSITKDMIIERYNKLRNNSWAYFALGCLLGAIAFIAIYGIKILNVTNVDWVMSSGDLTQHYIGWEFFRDSPWSFPIGMSENYGYPIGVAVTYTDSIPLIAIPLKLINGLLPDRFQYFGLWGLLCFALQGGFAAIIFKKYIKSTLLATIATGFVILSPTLLRKMFAHTALASHWLILVALAVWVYKDKFKTTKSRLLVWNAINLAAVLIHPYFLPMTMCIMLGFFIDELVHNRKFMDAILTGISSVTSVIVTFWAIGGFTGEASEAFGLGEFSMNINALFNPMGWSRILPFDHLPLARHGQYEGFQYLGLGIIIMIPIAFIVWYRKNKRDFKRLFSKKSIFAFIKNYSSVFIISIILFFIAVSNVITLNGLVLFEYKLPKVIEDLLNMFRSTGRLFWPVTYIIVFGLIIYISTRIKDKKIVFISLVFLLIIQIFDLSNKLIERNSYYTEEIGFNSTLKSELWDTIGESFDHIMLMPAYTNNFSHFSRLATDYEMTLNTGSYARGPYKKIDEIVLETIDDLKAGKSDDKTAYVTLHFNVLVDIMVNAPKDLYKVVNVDNYYVLYSNKDFKVDSNTQNVKVYTADDFVNISFEEYLDQRLNMDKEIGIIIAKKGISLELLQPSELEKLKELGVSTDLLKAIEQNYAAVILPKDKESSIERVSKDNLEIKLEKGSSIGGYVLDNSIIVRSGNVSKEPFTNLLINNAQHSMNRMGLNIITYDLKENKIIDIADFNLKNHHNGSVMRWK